MPKTSLKRLFTRTNHLKLMVDYCLVDPDILNALKTIRSVRVKTTIECGFNQGEKDKVLVAATEPKHRILLTANFNDINERKYPPCGHGGIILINHPRPDSAVVLERVKAFVLSGSKSEAKGHVTYLNKDKAIIHKLHKEKREVRF